MRQMMGNGGLMRHGDTGSAQESKMSSGMTDREGMMNGGGAMMAQMRQMMLQGVGPMANMQGHTPPMMQPRPQGGPAAETTP